jgi:hypothetical protein
MDGQYNFLQSAASSFEKKGQFLHIERVAGRSVVGWVGENI